MILSPTQSKLYNYLDIAFFPPETGPLSTLDWMAIIQLGYNNLLTLTELNYEYQACLKKIALYCQQDENKEKRAHLQTLMSMRKANISQLAVLNQLPHDIFIACLIAIALEKLAGHDLTLDEFLKRLSENQDLSFTLSEKNFSTSSIAGIHQSYIIEKIQEQASSSNSNKETNATQSAPIHFSYAAPKIQQSQEHKLQQLLTAISLGNATTAINLVVELPPNILNLKNQKTGATALQYALAYQRNDLAVAIIEKLIVAELPLDLSDAKALTPFHYNAELILQTITKIYSEYACSDYIRFAHVIAPDKKSWVIAKSQAVTEMRTQHEMIANMSAHPNIHTHQFSKEQIQQIAQDIDKAKSACCTTFAISLAQKLLTLTPTLAFKIVAYPNGMSSHCYISVTAPTGTTFLLDPWLASLGWGQGVYSQAKYPWPAALETTKIVFDTEQAKKYSMTI